MKYRFIITFLASLTLFACSEEIATDCSLYKKGRFKYKSSFYSDWVITRSDSIQVEYNKKDGVKLISEIEWISDCKYVLTYKKQINFNNNIIGNKVTVEIIKKNNDGYKYKSSSPNGNRTGTLIVKD